MRKPTFGLSIMVLTILTVFGIVAKEFRPLIPLPKPNSMMFESGDYMKQAAYQKVHWYPMGASAFNEAKRQGKPILMLIGTPWSQTGRSYDQRIFTDVDVAAFMERSFISIRVDGSIDPYWMNAMAPITRPTIGAIPDFQIWFLTPEGKPFDVMLFRSPGGTDDAPLLISRFINALKLLRATKTSDTPLTEQGAMHENDLAILANPGTKGRPDFDACDANLATSASPTHGGFLTVPNSGNVASFQRLLPNALRFFLLRREYDKFRASVASALTGPYFDWIDGGFFLRCSTEDWQNPQYDKLAVHNAEMMQVLALAGQLTGDKYYTYLAKRTFDSLATEFMNNGMIRACRVGDENRAARSNHSSFPPRLLRQLHDSNGVNTYKWAQDNLGLRVETNPNMVCMVSDPRVIESQGEALDSVLTHLRASAEERPTKFAGDSLAEVNLVCSAKMIFVSRLWNDSKRMEIATSHFDRCADFLIGDDVVHGLGLVNPPSAYLGDYLAYADAALQDYLANGRTISLQKGLKVFERARSLFRTSNPGVWAMTTENPLIPNCKQLPEIADTTHESCTARVIRLGNAYGRLLRGIISNADSKRTDLACLLAQDAYVTMERFTDSAEAIGPAAAGYYSACIGLLDNTHAYAVGPESAKRANLLFRRVPLRLISPCIGDVRPDLRDKKPGYYIVQGGTVSGPLSLDQAAMRLAQ